MAVTVHTHGIHYQWRLPEALQAQLHLAHRLREQLVSLHHEHEQRVRDIWSSYPEVAVTEAVLGSAEEHLRVQQKARAERAHQRATQARGPATETPDAATQLVRQARQARRTAIISVRAKAQAQLATARSQLTVSQRALYATYCQDQDLYWATFNDVLAHHTAAVQRVQKARAQGRPAALRHRRFDGSGSVAVQLQRQAGCPPRSPSTIADDRAGRWRNVFTAPWTAPEDWMRMSTRERRMAGRVTVRMRCGPGHIEVPVQMHRMLPADADITGARLTVRRVASGIRAHVTVTARLDDPESVTTGATVALHLGWLDDDAGTRVATWRSSEPLDISSDARCTLRANPGGLTGTVLMPARIEDRLKIADAIRSDRDIRLHHMRSALVGWLTEHGPLPCPIRDGVELTAEEVAGWRKPGWFSALASAWRDDPPARGVPAACARIAAELEAWRRADKRAWERQEHGRAKALAHRDDLYRKAAAAIAAQASYLVVDDTSVADVARAAAADDSLPPEVIAKIGRRRTMAAPGALRAAVIAACAREGVPVHTVSARGLSRIHAACGHSNPDDGRYLARPVPCDGCGATYDPDASATALMIRQAAAPPPDSPRAPTAPERAARRPMARDGPRER